MQWAIGFAIARVLAQGDQIPPNVDDDAVLLVKRHDVIVGCSTPDGGVDAGVGDAAIDAPADAAADAGIDGGVADAGTTCTMIPGDAVTMIVAPYIHAFQLPSQFAMLYVTPSRPFVDVTPGAFGVLPSLTGPEHVVHEVEVVDPSLAPVCTEDQAGCGGGGDTGGGCAPAPTWDPPGYGGGSDTTDGGVVVETIGPYDVLRVQPADRAQLVQWLDQVGFAYSDADVDAVVPYLMRGYHVVAARLSSSVVDSTAYPLAITWAGSELRLPTALAAAENPGLSLTVYVAADGTYEFPGAQIVFSAPTSFTMGTYVTRQVLTLAAQQSPDEDPIATRVYPDVNYHEVIEETHEVRVPPTRDCYQDTSNDSGGCCGDCSTHHRVRLDMIVLALTVTFVIRRRRRRWRV